MTRSNDDKQYYPVRCNECGWNGSSKDVLTDAFDQAWMGCRHCYSADIIDREEEDDWDGKSWCGHCGDVHLEDECFRGKFQ